MKPSAFEEKLFASATSSLLAEPVDERHTAMFVRDFCARAPWHVAFGLKLMLWLTWLSPLLLLGRTKTFFSIDETARAQVWTSALDHRFYVVRQLALVLKALACMCQFDDDAPRAPGLALVKESSS